MDTILHEQKLVRDLQEEYNKLINFYENVKRPSILIAYYNINVGSSDYQKELYSTYDNYNSSNIKFDLYEYTPVYRIEEINNQTTESEEMDGIRFEGNTTITTYTIKRPRINDLIRFYNPIKSDEIFRVRNFSTPINNIHSDPSVSWYQLELDYAPIETTEYLKILNHYIYNFSDQKYNNYNDYVNFIKMLNLKKEPLDKIDNFYSKKYDLYKYGNYVPLFVNEMVSFIKKEHYVDYKRIFEDYKLPYGYLELFNFGYYYGSIDNFPIAEMQDQNIYKVYNLSDKVIEDYIWDSYPDYEEGTIEELLYYGNQLLDILRST